MSDREKALLTNKQKALQLRGFRDDAYCKEIEQALDASEQRGYWRGREEEKKVWVDTLDKNVREHIAEKKS